MRYETFLKRSQLSDRQCRQASQNHHHQVFHDTQSRQSQVCQKTGLARVYSQRYPQAVRLIDLTLASTQTAAYARLREWLYYRKVRISVRFSPNTIPGTIAAMTAEFPTSRLLDDALAEQLYWQAIVLDDLDAARKTFQQLVDNHPKGNAVDNAYALMVEILSSKGHCEEANKMNEKSFVSSQSLGMPSMPCSDWLVPEVVDNQPSGQDLAPRESHDRWRRLRPLPSRAAARSMKAPKRKDPPRTTRLPQFSADHAEPSDLTGV